MKESLVSIIVPCFNGEKVMHRMLESILSQTYKSIEILFVNDGSTDKSEEVWKTYEKRFSNVGITYKYIFQENQGLGAAINTGLKVFSGEYLCWADVDDFFDNKSIEKRVQFLERNLEYGSVSSDANCLQEENLEKPISTIAEWMEHINEEWQFCYMLEGQSIFCSGCHMLRTSCFLDVNPERSIYPARRGQNYQMLLPVYYKYKHGFINEPLYNYVIYEKSMSTPDANIGMELERAEEFITLLKETLKKIDMDIEMVNYCENQLKRREWDIFSAIYIKYGEPMNLLYRYLKLNMYKTEQKREIKGIIKAVENKILDKKEYLIDKLKLFING